MVEKWISINKVNLYEICQSEDIIFSETARNIASACKNDIVTIDFAHIEFCSRSFLHTLFKELVNKKVFFINVEFNIKEMMLVAVKDCGSNPEIWLCFNHNYIKVRYSDM